jgi:hypothetical protein
LESHGLKKNFVVEQALLYFMEARRELPDEALAPVRLAKACLRRKRVRRSSFPRDRSHGP